MHSRRCDDEVDTKGSARLRSEVRLVRTAAGRVDPGEGLVESAGSGSAAVRVLVSGADLHGAVPAGGAHEFLDAPAGLVFDPEADG